MVQPRKMLTKVLELREEIYIFMSENGQDIPELHGGQWLLDLLFLTDITTKLNVNEISCFKLEIN